MWVKNRYPKWNPGKWKQRLKPAVPWSFSFDPYPLGQIPKSAPRQRPQSHFCAGTPLRWGRPIHPHTSVRQIKCDPKNGKLAWHPAFGEKWVKPHVLPHPQQVSYTLFQGSGRKAKKESSFFCGQVPEAEAAERSLRGSKITAHQAFERLTCLAGCRDYMFQPNRCSKQPQRPNIQAPDQVPKPTQDGDLGPRLVRTVVLIYVQKEKEEERKYSGAWSCRLK